MKMHLKTGKKYIDKKQKEINEKIKFFLNFMGIA